MNDDYLWDKSGEPDPEIQELEQILAPLRYQPTPLEMPNELPVTRRRNYFPLLAIAATVLVALLATGLWLSVRSRNSGKQQEVASVKPTVIDEAPPAPPVGRKIETPSPKPIHKKINRRGSNSVLAKRDREEALAAKEQVMLALRLASEKLKLAQRRTQGASPNQIKNQHKIG